MQNSNEFENVPILVKGPTTKLIEQRKVEPVTEKRIPVTAIDFSARRINNAAEVSRSIELNESLQ